MKIYIIVGTEFEQYETDKDVALSILETLNTPYREWEKEFALWKKTMEPIKKACKENWMTLCAVREKLRTGNVSKDTKMEDSIRGLYLSEGKYYSLESHPDYTPPPESPPSFILHEKEIGVPYVYPQNDDWEYDD